MASTTPGPTNLGMPSNIAGLLCYAPCCVGFVFSVIVAIVEKQSRSVRFHAFQSLLVHAAAFVLGIGLWMVSLVAGMVVGVLGFILSLLQFPIGLAILGLLIFMMIKANNNEDFQLPVVGELAAKWAAGE